MNPLKSIGGTIASGFILAVILVILTGDNTVADAGSLIIWLHVLAGVTWIGLLYYFNFVQVPAAAMRAGSTVTTAGTANPGLATGELVGASLVSGIAVFAPIAIPMIVLALGAAAYQWRRRN